MEKKTHNSLKESLQIIAPIARGAINQLKVLSPKEGTWISDSEGGYQKEVDALRAIEQYLNYLKKEGNDIKIRREQQEKKPWFGGEKAIPFPEDVL